MGMTFDDKELWKLEQDLRKLKERAIPFATRWAIHLTSKEAAKEARYEVGVRMINRNKWTQGSVQYSPSSANKISLNVRRQQASVGSTEQYLATQEFGGTSGPAKGASKPIPTSYSAGQEGAKPRTKLPKRDLSLRNIRLRRNRIKAKTPAQKVAASINNAIKTGDRKVYLDTPRGKGIYLVVGGRRVHRGRSGAKLRLLYDLGNKQVTIRPNSWLAPAMIRASVVAPRFYMDALKHQLDRLGAFK